MITSIVMHMMNGMCMWQGKLVNICLCVPVHDVYLRKSVKIKMLLWYTEIFCKKSKVNVDIHTCPYNSNTSEYRI